MDLFNPYVIEWCQLITRWVHVIAGIAWIGGSELRRSRPAVAAADGIRSPMTSYGVGLRVNMLGFAVLRLDYAVPQDRPRKGGYWILSLGPPF